MTAVFVSDMHWVRGPARLSLSLLPFLRRFARADAVAADADKISLRRYTSGRAIETL